MTTGRYQLQDIFVRHHFADNALGGNGRAASGLEGSGAAYLTSELIPTGHLPSQMEQLAQYGTKLPDAVLAAAKNAGVSP
jgi:hypothetical protein